MRPCISVGYGGCLQFINSPMGPRVVSQDLTNAIDTAGEVINEYNATLTAGVDSNYWESLFGGPMSMLPMNTPHKPAAFYFGHLYFYKHDVSIGNGHFLLRFDGSGIFSQEGSSDFNNKSLSGRGTEFLSPSGSTLIAGGPMCVLPHNGSIFWVGSTFDRNFDTELSPYVTQLDWDTGPNDGLTQTGDDDGNAIPRRRAYCSYFITKQDKDSKEHRGFGKLALRYKRTGPSGLTTSYEDLNACDAISWGDDIIYANNVDIVQYPGGSGMPRLIELTNNPSSKSLEAHPSGGFLNGSSVGDTQLMVLYGSGVVRKVNFQGDPEYNSNGRPFGADIFTDVQEQASGLPFGTKSLVNLGLLVSDSVGPKVRTGGALGRVGSTSENPDRTCLLKTHNDRLHAFFISKASGYYHFTCEGDPRTLDNWTDRTTSLPNDLRIRDGNIYGFRDDEFGTLNILHVAYSNIGAFGTQGGNTGAGGWTLYQLNHNLQWTTLYHGASNGPPCGLIPYNPESVYSQIPSGINAGNPVATASTDYVQIEYRLFSPRKPNRFANVKIEYTTNNGLSWNTARRFRDYSDGSLLGEGLTDLEASPSGTPHTFYWAHVSDLGFNFNKAVKVRVVPTFVR